MQVNGKNSKNKRQRERTNVYWDLQFKKNPMALKMFKCVVWFVYMSFTVLQLHEQTEFVFRASVCLKQWVILSVVSMLFIHTTPYTCTCI